MNEIAEVVELPDSCDRCKAPGKFRGGACYGCIQTVQELDRAINDIKAAQILAVFLEDDDENSELGDRTRRFMTQAITRLEALRDGGA
jgi:hypothetical protein